MPDYPVDYRKEFTEMYRAARNYQNYRKAQELEDLQDLEALDALEAELDLEDELELETQEEPERRKPGAPLGNQNARKHGLYSRLLPPESAEDFHYAVLLRDAAEDLGAFRLFAAELLRDPNRDPKVVIAMFNAMARMLNAQRRYRGS